MLCILYVIVVSALLGVAGLLVERSLPTTAPRRWVWCVVIAISILIPPIYRTHHNSSVIEALEQRTVHAAGSSAVSAPLLPVLDPAWWSDTGSINKTINRLWMTSSAALIVWGLASALWVAGVVHLSRRRRGGRRGPTVIDDVPVVVTDTMGPATVGVLRARVLLPKWVLALPNAQRRYVVRHEEEHRRAYDASLLCLASLTLVLTPWNLALWWLLRRLHLAIEMDCDNRVVAALGDAPAYGELLLKVAQAASRGPRIQPAFLGGVGMLERRLTMLLQPTPLRHAQRFIVPALACGLVVLVLSMPHPIVGSRSVVHGATSADSTEQGRVSASATAPESGIRSTMRSTSNAHPASASAGASAAHVHTPAATGRAVLTSGPRAKQ